MNVVRIILLVLFIIDSLALAAIVLIQERKAYGIGSISCQAETYWGKNKGRSMEGAMVKITTVLAVLFFVLAAVLNTRFF